MAHVAIPAPRGPEFCQCHQQGSQWIGVGCTTSRFVPAWDGTQGNQEDNPSHHNCGSTALGRPLPLCHPLCWGRCISIHFFLQKFSALPMFVPCGIKWKLCGITCVIIDCMSVSLASHVLTLFAIFSLLNTQTIQFQVPNHKNHIKHRCAIWHLSSEFWT